MEASSRCAGTQASRVDRHPNAVRSSPRVSPDAPCGAHGTLSDYLASIKSDGQKGFWTAADAYIVSLLKAWFRDAATRTTTMASTGCPGSAAITGTYQTTVDMLDGTVEGISCSARTPPSDRRTGSCSARRCRI